MKKLIVLLIFALGFLIGLFSTYEDRYYHKFEWNWYFKTGINKEEKTETCLIHWAGDRGRSVFCIDN